MTTHLPERIPLEMPAGDAHAVADLARDIAAAGRCLAAVDARIAGPAAEAPGWLGDDAAAAAAQVLAVDSLIRAAHDAVMTAAERLTAHAERLLGARARVRALREEQDEHFRQAWRRCSQLPDLQVQVMIDGPAMRAIVHDVEAGEASRRRRHAALIEEIDEDAAATARVLVQSCAAVGGRGVPGEAEIVVGYLAAELPGWGDLELARNGRALARRLTDGTPAEEARAATAAAAFAGRTSFADAFLAALGTVGVAYVLRNLGSNRYEPDNAVARDLAAAFGAASGEGTASASVQTVLDARYVRPEDGFGSAGPVATGLAMVLAAGRSTPSGGVAAGTAATWARQFLLWEHEQGAPIGTRSAAWAPEVGDPTGLAISILAERADPAVCSALLDDPVVWGAVLRRVYDDGGAALGEVVAQAGREPGHRGDRVLRLGLATAGAGLAGDDPYDWTVNRDTLRGAASGFGVALGEHVDVAVGALRTDVDGKLPGTQADVLAGLGYVTLDRDAAAAIERALVGWTQVRPEALGSVASWATLPAAAVLGAYVAVQEFAQRTDHAMDAMEDRAEAQAKQSLEKYTFGLATELLPGPTGIGLGLIEAYTSIPRHTDGTWRDRPDRGLFFGRGDAAALARAALAPRESSGVRDVVREAAAAFDRTAAALPAPRAPISPKSDPLAPVADLAADFEGERPSRGQRGTIPRSRLPR